MLWPKCCHWEKGRFGSKERSHHVCYRDKYHRLCQGFKSTRARTLREWHCEETEKKLQFRSFVSEAYPNILMIAGQIPAAGALHFCKYVTRTS